MDNNAKNKEQLRLEVDQLRLKSQAYAEKNALHRNMNKSLRNRIIDEGFKWFGV